MTSSVSNSPTLTIILLDPSNMNVLLRNGGQGHDVRWELISSTLETTTREALTIKKILKQTLNETISVRAFQKISPFPSKGAHDLNATHLYMVGVMKDQITLPSPGNYRWFPIADVPLQKISTFHRLALENVTPAVKTSHNQRIIWGRWTNH